MFNSFAEEVKVVNILPPKDISAAAHSTAYVDVQNYQHVTFIVSMGATGAVGSSKNITLKQAKSTSGSSAANLPIGKYWHNGTAIGSASIANDTYAAASVASSGAAVALTASSNNIVYMFEIDTSKLSASMDAVGIGVATTSAAAICGATAILSKARYLSSSPPSAL